MWSQQRHLHSSAATSACSAWSVPSASTGFQLRRFAEFLRQVRYGLAGAVGNLKVRRGEGEGERGFTTE